MLVQADRLVGGSDAVLVIDDTAIAKKGTHSVGVAAQYASALGKTANCQTLVSLTLARGEVSVMLALRLFFPESWTSKRARLERAGVPAEYRTARTKPEMALAGRLPDAAVPVSGTCLTLSMAAEDMLADATWQDISWRTGTKAKLKARFACCPRAGRRRTTAADQGPAGEARAMVAISKSIFARVMRHEADHGISARRRGFRAFCSGRIPCCPRGAPQGVRKCRPPRHGCVLHFALADLTYGCISPSNGRSVHATC